MEVSSFFTVPISFPFRKTVISSAISMTSLSLWEMKTTAQPASETRRIMPNSSRISGGVSTEVGSSRMSVCAPW